MCAVSRVSCSSICRASVQMRLAISCSSKSARCMNDAKFSPSPTGSRIVNRTLPGGIAVSIRSITSCSTSIASRRPSSSAVIKQHRVLLERHQRRQLDRRLRRPQPLVLRNAVLDLRQVERHVPEPNRRRGLGRLRPVVVVGRCSNRETAARTRLPSRSHASRISASPRRHRSASACQSRSCSARSSRHAASYSCAILSVAPVAVFGHQRQRSRMLLLGLRAESRSSSPRNWASRCGNVCPARPISRFLPPLALADDRMQLLLRRRPDC